MTDEYEDALKDMFNWGDHEEIGDWAIKHKDTISKALKLASENEMLLREKDRLYKLEMSRFENLSLEYKKLASVSTDNALEHIKQFEHKINGLHGIIEGQKVIVSELEAELDKYKWKPIDDYARSGEPVIIAYIDCSTISYAVCDYIDDIDGYLSFCTCSDRSEVFEDKILGYMPIPDFEENRDE